jgi:hypothetical protein
MVTASEVFVMVNDERIKLEGEALAAYKADQKINLEYEASLAKEIEAKETAKAAIYAKLGLTPDEVALLFK